VCPTHRSRPAPFCLRRPSAAAQPGAARAQLVLRPIDSGSALEPFRTLPASTPLCLRPTCCSPRGPAWSWSSPNSPRGLHQALDAPPPVEPESSPSVVRRSVRIRFPLPCSAWEHLGLRRVGGQPPGGEIPSSRDDFPNIRWVVHSSSTEKGCAAPESLLVSVAGKSAQAPRTAPARSAPRAAKPPTAPVAPRTGTELVVPWMPAAAPEIPTRRSFTRRVTW